MRLALALLALGSAALAGCSVERPASATPAGTAAAPREPASQLCASRRAGWVIEFPGSWHTNADGAAAACTFFHPDPFEVPERPETLVVAISVAREQAPFAVAVTDAYRRDVRAEDFELDGRRARRADYVATGQAFVPAGMRVYEIVVDLGRDSLIATLRDVEGLDFERGRRILDRMVESLRLEA
ncbi:MAG TPA: hypothetical protein VEY87_05520 [Gaiellaceae bacterium]|jgi:hypothetical protein|nr:hypothetical protein [Gaiellaceae bacterium]